MGKRVKNYIREDNERKHITIQKQAKMPLLFRSKIKADFSNKITSKRQIFNEHQSQKLLQGKKWNEGSEDIQQDMLNKQNQKCSSCKEGERFIEPISGQSYQKDLGLCIDNNQSFQKQQQVWKHITLQQLERLHFVDYFYSNWQSCIIIKINRTKNIKTVVLLQIPKLQLSEQIFDDQKFRKPEEGRKISIFFQQNRQVNDIIVKKIDEYWHVLQNYTKQTNYKHKYGLYLNLCKMRQRLIQDIAYLRCFKDRKNYFVQDENFHKKHQTGMTNDLQDWLFYQLSKQEGQIYDEMSIIQPSQQEQLSFQLQKQMKDMSIKQSIQIIPEDQSLFIEHYQQSLSYFAQFQIQNSLFNQPYSCLQQRIQQNYLQQQNLFQQLDETYL